jgi:hypothetical protein
MQPPSASGIQAPAICISHDTELITEQRACLMKAKTYPVFLAFLAMGFGDAVGPFVGLAKNEFTLSNTLAFLIPFMGFIVPLVALLYIGWTALANLKPAPVTR